MIASAILVSITLGISLVNFGNIELPVAISKSTFDHELDFYGINSVGGSVTATSFAQVVESLHQEVDHSIPK